MTGTGADLALLEAFAAALQAEHDALVANRTDDLAVLADHKLDCAQRLEREATPAFAAALRETQARLQRGAAPASADDGALHQRLRQAAELNRLNGRLIDQHLNRVRLSLARIEPVSPTRQLYGRDGQGQGSPLGRSFGAA
jgi:flagellar biosynthesis/type III secretory pathway chaperone